VKGTLFLFNGCISCRKCLLTSLCMKWYNGSTTPRLQSCVINQWTVEAVPTVGDSGISVLNHCLPRTVFTLLYRRRILIIPAKGSLLPQNNKNGGVGNEFNSHSCCYFSYEIVVIASDGGDPAKSGSMIVSIKVVDVNDNIPIFDNSTYEVRYHH